MGNYVVSSGLAAFSYLYLCWPPQIKTKWSGYMILVGEPLPSYQVMSKSSVKTENGQMTSDATIFCST